MKTKAIRVFSVAGWPLLHFPNDWNSGKIAAIVRDGFGVQSNDKPHKWGLDEGDDQGMFDYYRIVSMIVASRFQKNPAAVRLVLALDETRALKVFQLLDTYRVTAEEAVTLCLAYDLNLEAFRENMQNGEALVELWKIRNLLGK